MRGRSPLARAKSRAARPDARFWPRSVRLSLRSEDASNGRDVVVFVAAKPARGSGVEVRRRDGDQANAVLWDEFVAPCVIQRPLDSAVNSADSEPFRFVEMGHRLAVLPLPILHHQVRHRPVTIDWEPNTASRPARVTHEPLESVLTRTTLAQNAITEVQHVCFIAGFSTHDSEATHNPRSLICRCGVQPRFTTDPSAFTMYSSIPSSVRTHSGTRSTAAEASMGTTTAKRVSGPGRS